MRVAAWVHGKILFAQETSVSEWSQRRKLEMKCILKPKLNKINYKTILWLSFKSSALTW